MLINLCNLWLMMMYMYNGYGCHKYQLVIMIVINSMVNSSYLQAIVIHHSYPWLITMVLVIHGYPWL